MALAAGLALAVTPAVRRWAFKCGAVDRPDHRKVHRRTMPRMGGLAVYISFAAAVLLTREITFQTAGLLAGGSVIVLFGILDDTRGLSPRLKLAGQIVAALAVIPFGLQVEFLTNPFGGDVIDLGLLAVPVTVLWLVAVTNAVNLIDGLDGLAGGTSFIAALTLAAVVWIDITANGGSPGQADALALTLILAAAVLGFLRYNFFPAKIFLGDTGSMFLGFSVAALAVMGLAKGATFISVVVPVVILGIPILDTFFAVVRRWSGHRPIFSPDKEHLHHRLMDLGLSHRQAVLCIYGVNFILGLSAIVLTLLTPGQAVVLLLILSTAALLIANKIGVTGLKSSRSSYLSHEENHQRSSRM
ncbi:MAG: undecaprenyl/decaprenyl-phosphate alpha-N-acetylglucosaminyl 1-phosphate transferase [Firmicutes bacterium]|nr:undecaprenyl/decaprenyl-phosphate alpha-N-acetylglucosaminyl 1-phosphate transferase [Bacillota bacterium]